MLVYADKRFTHPLKTLMAFNNRELIAAFEAIDAYKDRYFLLGYIRYEAKDVFAGLPMEQDLPLLYFEVFDGFEPYTPGSAGSVVLDPKPALSFEEYAAALGEIREEIAQGNTYEVNYTYDVHVHAPQQLEPFALYEYLLTKQTTPYNCFIQNDYDTVLSFSPELFFELSYARVPGGHILTKPMKGTVRRGKNAAEDAQLRSFLQHDVKNRAENVMIVDLLRNDLGRIAQTGSVRVSKLFTIESHPTLHQMTSQIEADLKEDTSLYEVFKALFPCGSITGAPKISTMRIIDRVEQGKRNIYCGAIGYIRPGHLTFSVPIRILQKSCKDACFIYRVGGAIVWDSDIQDEWKETLTKTKLLSADFLLIETMKVEQGVILFRKEHFARLKKSAGYFGFALDERIWAVQPEKDGILRLLLDKQGRSTLEYKDLVPASSTQVRISPVRVDSGDIFLYHKTSYRPYFSARQEPYKTFYDELFFNEKGELTEGSRTNIVLEIQGRRYTPPESCGLLNGVYRQVMLDRGECSEKILHHEDLLRAEHIYCVNSVRGMQEVTLV
ncbi:MAG: chorismate-binding protein [Treponema sp.]|jgi:para-aminobenzoate synthetase/4-amino-4-deoxychorismate lyase|nr:chorismate-binding protein [Treponema sp.]